MFYLTGELISSSFSARLVNLYFNPNPRLDTLLDHGTICPRSSDLFYIVSYYIKWVTTSWTHSLIDSLEVNISSALQHLQLLNRVGNDCKIGAFLTQILNDFSPLILRIFQLAQYQSLHFVAILQNGAEFGSRVSFFTNLNCVILSLCTTHKFQNNWQKLLFRPTTYYFFRDKCSMGKYLSSLFSSRNYVDLLIVSIKHLKKVMEKQ